MGAVLECMSKKEEEEEQQEEEKRSPTVPKKILNQIFLGLPVKTLLKFKCVCKEWISILEDPEFVDSHRVRSHTRSGGIGVLELNTSLYKQLNQDEFPALFIVDPDKEKDSELAKILLPTGLKMYTETPQCVEGLICFENFVVNPSTREVIELPDQRKDWELIDCLYYIGYHSRSKTYKVLSLLRISERLDCTTHVRQAMLRGQVLTLGTTHSNSNSWRDVIMPANYEYLSLLIHAYLSVDDKIFFLTSLRREKKQSLLAFDIEDERFIMPLDDLPWDPNNRVSTLEVNGRFAVMEMNPRRKRERTMWVLVNYMGKGGTWTKRKIVFPEAIFDLTDCFPVGNIIHSSSNTEILFKAWGPPDRQPLNPLCEILFKAWGRPAVPQPLNNPAGRFFYFYYNMETNSFRVGKKSDSADIWFSKNVETMFQLQPRPEPTHIVILQYKLRHMHRKY